jgi:hypothetical protein
MTAACRVRSVRVDFLAALTCNESGGEIAAARFEPVVYRRLQDVAAGKCAYGVIGSTTLNEAIDSVRCSRISPLRNWTQSLGLAAEHHAVISLSSDDVLRRFATSWGYTQIMGYHVIGRGVDVDALVQPEYHFNLAAELLAGFAHTYKLSLSHDFAELFRCWNTGQPHGKTHDPNYVENGLRRMEIYRQLAAAVPVSKPVTAPPATQFKG